MRISSLDSYLDLSNYVEKMFQNLRVNASLSFLHLPRLFDTYLCWVFSLNFFCLISAQMMIILFIHVPPHL